MSILTSLFLILLLVILSAFFSCAEIALAASRKIRLEILSKEGNGEAQRVLNLQAQPGSFFTVVQIGLNAVAILGGVIGAPIGSGFGSSCACGRGSSGGGSSDSHA